MIILGKHGLVSVILNLFGIASLNLIYNEFAVIVGLSQIMCAFRRVDAGPGDHEHQSGYGTGGGKFRGQ